MAVFRGIWCIEPAQAAAEAEGIVATVGARKAVRDELAEHVEAYLAAGGKVREPKELMRRQSRVFQALRIEVNQEIAELENVLHAAAELIKPGGRLAIMSYHSLEDRRAKRLLRSGTFFDTPPPKDAYGNVLAPWKPLTRQAVVASEAEVERNTRARSARLRIGERTEHPAVPPSEESGPARRTRR